MANVEELSAKDLVHTQPDIPGKGFFHTQPVIPFPQCSSRQMIKVSHNSNAPSFRGPSFTIVTYNVLAEVCATSAKYPNCPSLALSWEYRRQSLLKEILQCDADIICLQEVQWNHFSNFFNPELSKTGYQGLFKEKQRRCLSTIVDGCATFYRLDKFELITSWSINLSSFATYFPRFQRDNIALNVHLSFKSTGQGMCITNTHIHANPRNSDVKLWQVCYMLNNLEVFVKDNYDVPIVICGDFNSLPGSAPYSLLTKGYVHPFDKEISDYDPSGQLAQQFRHTIPLASAYYSYSQCDVSQVDIKKKMNGETGEPRFTNFAKNFRGTLDYIFYSTTNLKVVSLLELIDEEEVKDDGLPSLNRSSDHIPIAAKFRYISNKKPANINKICSNDGQLQENLLKVHKTEKT